MSQGAYSIQIQIAADASPLTALTQALGTVNQNVQTTISSVNNIGTALQAMGGRISSVSAPLQQLTSAETQAVGATQQLASSAQQLTTGITPLSNQFTNLTSSTQRVGAIFQQTVGTSQQLSQSLTQMVGSQSSLANAGQQLTGVFTAEQTALNSTVNIAQRADLQFKNMVGSQSALASSVEGASGGLTGQNTLLQQSSTAADKASVAHKSLGQSFQQTALGVAFLATGVLSIISSYTNLERAQLAVDKANKTVLSTQAKLTSATDAHTKAVNQFGEGSKQAADTLVKMKAAQEGHTNAVEAARLKQVSFNEQLGETAASAGPQIISVLSGLAQVYSTIKTAIDTARGSKVADTAATVANTASVEANNAAGAGSVGFLGKIKGLFGLNTGAKVLDTEATVANTAAMEANNGVSATSATMMGRLRGAFTGTGGAAGILEKAVVPAGIAVAGIGTAAAGAAEGSLVLAPALGGLSTETAAVAGGAIAAEAGIGEMSLAIPVLGIAIAAGIAALIAYQTNFLGFRDVVNNAAAALLDFGNAAGSALGKGAAEVFGPMIQGANEFLDTMAKGIQQRDKLLATPTPTGPREPPHEGTQQFAPKQPSGPETPVPGGLTFAQFDAQQKAAQLRNLQNAPGVIPTPFDSQKQFKTNLLQQQQFERNQELFRQQRQKGLLQVPGLAPAQPIAQGKAPAGDIEGFRKSGVAANDFTKNLKELALQTENYNKLPGSTAEQLKKAEEATKKAGLAAAFHEQAVSRSINVDKAGEGVIKELTDTTDKLTGTELANGIILKDTDLKRELVTQGALKQQIVMQELAKSNISNAEGLKVYGTQLQNTGIQQELITSGSQKQQKAFLDQKGAIFENIGGLREYAKELGSAEGQSVNFQTGQQNQQKALLDSTKAVQVAKGELQTYAEQVGQGSQQAVAFVAGQQAQTKALLDSQVAIAKTSGELQVYAQQVALGVSGQVAFTQGQQAQTKSMLDQEVAIKKTEGELTVYNQQIASGIAQGLAMVQAINATNKAYNDAQVELAGLDAVIANVDAAQMRYNTAVTQGHIAFDQWIIKTQDASVANKTFDADLVEMTGGMEVLGPLIEHNAANLKLYAEAALGSAEAFQKLQESQKVFDELGKAAGKVISDIASQFDDLEKRTKKPFEKLPDIVRDSMTPAGANFALGLGKMEALGRDFIGQFGNELEAGGIEGALAYTENFQSHLKDFDQKAALAPIIEGLRSGTKEGVTGALAELSKLGPQGAAIAKDLAERYGIKMEDIVASTKGVVNRAIAEWQRLAQARAEASREAAFGPTGTGGALGEVKAALTKPTTAATGVPGPDPAAVKAVTDALNVLNEVMVNTNTNAVALGQAFTATVTTMEALATAVAGTQTLLDTLNTVLVNTNTNAIALGTGFMSSTTTMEAFATAIVGTQTLLDVLNTVLVNTMANAVALGTGFMSSTTTLEAFAVSVVGTQTLLDVLNTVLVNTFANSGTLATGFMAATTGLEAFAVGVVATQGLLDVLNTVLVNTIANAVGLGPAFTTGSTAAQLAMNALAASVSINITAINTIIATVAPAMTTAFGTGTQNAAGSMNALNANVHQNIQAIVTYVNTIPGVFNKAFGTAAQDAAGSMNSMTSTVNADLNTIVTHANAAAAAVRTIGSAASSAAGEVRSLTAAMNAIPNITRTITIQVNRPSLPSGFGSIASGGAFYVANASRFLVGESGAEQVARIKAEAGMSQMITKPTSLMVGESGPEFLFVKPMNTNNNTKSGHSDTNPMFMAGGTYKGAQSPYALASDTNTLLDSILKTLQDIEDTGGSGRIATIIPGTGGLGTGTGLTTTATGNTQIINANGYKLVGNGSGNAFLKMENGIPIEWGGGILYDPQGNIVSHGTPTNVPPVTTTPPGTTIPGTGGTTTTTSIALPGMAQATTGTSGSNAFVTASRLGGTSQMISAQGWTLIGGSGAYLQMIGGIPVSWGGGALYDPQGRFVMQREATTAPAAQFGSHLPSGGISPGSMLQSLLGGGTGGTGGGTTIGGIGDIFGGNLTQWIQDLLDSILHGLPSATAIVNQTDSMISKIFAKVGLGPGGIITTGTPSANGGFSNVNNQTTSGTNVQFNGMTVGTPLTQNTSAVGSQIIKANGYKLVGDGTGQAFLTMKDGLPETWGGGTLYDPAGNVVEHGTATTTPPTPTPTPTTGGTTTGGGLSTKVQTMIEAAMSGNIIEMMKSVGIDPTKFPFTIFGGGTTGGGGTTTPPTTTPPGGGAGQTEWPHFPFRSGQDNTVPIFDNSGEVVARVQASAAGKASNLPLIKRLTGQASSIEPPPGGGGGGGTWGTRTGREIMSWEEADTRQNPNPYLAQSWTDFIQQVAAALSSQPINVNNHNHFEVDSEQLSVKMNNKKLRRITSFR